MKHIRFYIPKPADVLIWYKNRGILGLLLSLLGSDKYYHASMVVPDHNTGLFYNYEQNIDIVSEKPRLLGEIISRPSLRRIVARPNLPKIVNNLKFNPGQKISNHNKLLFCITRSMEQIIPFGYNELDVFRSHWSWKRKPASIKNGLIADRGVEFLYSYKLPGSDVEWTAVECRDSLTCAAAVASAFALCGVQLFPFLPWYALPKDFLRTPLLDVLGYVDYTSALVSN